MQLPSDALDVLMSTRVSPVNRLVEGSGHLMPVPGAAARRRDGAIHGYNDARQMPLVIRDGRWRGQHAPMSNGDPVPDNSLVLPSEGAYPLHGAMATSAQKDGAIHGYSDAVGADGRVRVKPSSVRDSRWREQRTMENCSGPETSLVLPSMSHVVSPPGNSLPPHHSTSFSGPFENDPRQVGVADRDASSSGNFSPTASTTASRRMPHDFERSHFEWMAQQHAPGVLHAPVKHRPPQCTDPDSLADEQTRRANGLTIGPYVAPIEGGAPGVADAPLYGRGRLNGLEGFDHSARRQRSEYAVREQHVKQQWDGHAFGRADGSALGQRAEYAAHERRFREGTESCSFRRACTGVTAPDLASGAAAHHHAGRGGDLDSMYDALRMPGRMCTDVWSPHQQRPQLLQHG